MVILGLNLSLSLNLDFDFDGIKSLSLRQGGFVYCSA